MQVILILYSISHLLTRFTLQTLMMLVVCQVFGGWAPGALSDLRKIDMAIAPLSWSLLSPTGDTATGRNGHVMVHAGNGLVYMMGGSNIQSPGNHWDLMMLDAKPTPPRWTKVASYLVSAYSSTVNIKRIQVWEDQVYATGHTPFSSAWTTSCESFAVLSMNLSAPTKWTSVSKMYATLPCRSEVISEGPFTMRYYTPQDSTTSAFLVFDIKTLGIQVRCCIWVYL
jgi:hypothetical protein